MIVEEVYSFGSFREQELNDWNGLIIGGHLWKSIFSCTYIDAQEVSYIG